MVIAEHTEEKWADIMWVTDIMCDDIPGDDIIACDVSSQYDHSNFGNQR